MFGSNLGVANGFNTFIFSDITQSNVDAQGRVAGDGNVNYTNFMVGTLIGTVDVTMDDLVVGNTLTATNLTVDNGNIAIASATGTSLLMDPTAGGWVSTYGNLNAGTFGQIGSHGGKGGVETGGTFTNNYNNTGTVTNLGGQAILPSRPEWISPRQTVRCSSHRRTGRRLRIQPTR